MADKTYDLVYVGAGSMNLVNAMYATKYGKLKVGMFEDRHEAGGGEVGCVGVISHCFVLFCSTVQMPHLRAYLVRGFVCIRDYRDVHQTICFALPKNRLFDIVVRGTLGDNRHQS